MAINGFNSHVENYRLNGVSQMLVFRVKRHHISVMMRESIFAILLEIMTILEDKKKFQYEGMSRKDVLTRIN